LVVGQKTTPQVHTRYGGKNLGKKGNPKGGTSPLEKKETKFYLVGKLKRNVGERNEDPYPIPTVKKGLRGGMKGGHEREGKIHRTALFSGESKWLRKKARGSPGEKEWRAEWKRRQIQKTGFLECTIHGGKQGGGSSKENSSDGWCIKLRGTWIDFSIVRGLKKTPKAQGEILVRGELSTRTQPAVRIVAHLGAQREKNEKPISDCGGMGK